MTTRRGFLKNGGLALFGIGLGGLPAFIAEAANLDKARNPFKRKKILVCVFQRGAMDGLMAVTPFTDAYLRDARPTLFMSPAKAAKSSLIDLDGRFGLHPAMKSFEPLFRSGNLAIVHGIGSPNNTRSHFDAQDYMESGTPFDKATSSGWLNRAVGLSGHENISPFKAVSLTTALPRSFFGDNSSLAISDLRDFGIRTKGNVQGVGAAKSFEELYDRASSDLLKQTGKESFEAIKMLREAEKKANKSGSGTAYPNSDLGKSLKQIAELIRMDVGLEIAFAESGGWDTHFNQGTGTGTFAKNAADLSNSITAFWNDLGTYRDDVLIMSMTEFGRTVKQNGTGGTDHGRASCNFILSSDVKGGIVHGLVESLAVENLEDGRDLRVTTDFRAVFQEVAGSHLQLTKTAGLFPGWEGKSIGVMKS